MAAGAVVVDVAECSGWGRSLPDGPIVVWDPIGGPIAVSLVEPLGERGVLVTPDQIVGNELARTGDLVAANARLLGAGVTIERRSVLRAVRPGEVELEDRFTGARRTIPAAAVVDAGFRLPDEPWRSSGRPGGRLRRPAHHPRGRPRRPPGRPRPGHPGFVAPGLEFRSPGRQKPER